MFDRLVNVDLPKFEAQRKPPKNITLVWRSTAENFPPVSSTTAVASKALKTIATKRAKQVILTAPVMPKLTNQYIVTQNTERIITKLLSTPNLLAMAPKTPDPPKQFTAPASQPKRAEPVTLKTVDLPAPEIAVAKPTASMEIPLPKVQPKRFQPPDKPRPVGKQIVVQVEDLHLGRGAEGVPSAADEALRTIQNVPAPIGPPAKNSGVQAAVISVKPRPDNDPLPEGSRPGSISVGDKVGKKPSAAQNPADYGVPGLTTTGKRGAQPGETAAVAAPDIPHPVPRAVRELSYRDVIDGVMPLTFSAPLRPGGRRLPPEIESKFANRVVYVLTIPPPRLAQYRGDWTLWFAEQADGSSSVNGGTVRAPMLDKKRVLASDEGGAYNGEEIRARVEMKIEANGRIGEIACGEIVPAAVRNEVIADLTSWFFKPAMKSGVPVAVDVILMYAYRPRTTAGR